MRLIRYLKRAFKQLQAPKAHASGIGSVASRFRALVSEIERSTATHQDAARARAIRLSAGRISVRNNLGSYTSKVDGDLAVEMLERWEKKAGCHDGAVHEKPGAMSAPIAAISFDEKNEGKADGCNI